MALEKQLADTDSVYCTKVTNSNQSSIFISNLGVAELGVLFGADYKNDDVVRLRLDKRNLAFNAVAHAIDGKAWYKRKSNDKWSLGADWLEARLAALESAFAGERGVFLASLNKDDHSTNRLYMKGMTSLLREDEKAGIVLRDFLFSGDVIVLSKLDNGDVSFEVKIPDNPIIEFAAKKDESGKTPISRQQIAYGAPGTGKSYGVKTEVAGERVIRTTFHPDSDYATFVGAYKPTMEFAPRTFMKGEEITKVAKGDASLLEEKRIVYKFVPQAFLQAYEKAWKFKVDAAQKGVTAKRQYLVIEEINRGNCAQIFGDLFQLLDRNDAGFSDYEIVADEDLRRHLAEKFVDAAKANEATPLDLGIDPALAKRVLSGEALLLPDNLFIRATMNTSDQSLFPIDSAFKRRWDWKYVPIAKPKDPDADWKERVIVANGQTFDWWRFLEIVNAQILEATKSEDKQLGYFFVKAPDATGEISASQFTGKVLFYLYNDVFRDETPPANLFGDGSDGNTQYRFKMFFDEQGEPKEDVVAAFLAQLFKKNPEKGKSAEASAGDAAKGTDEA